MKSNLAANVITKPAPPKGVSHDPARVESCGIGPEARKQAGLSGLRLFESHETEADSVKGGRQ
jgi:hypothetical protein